MTYFSAIAVVVLLSFGEPTHKGGKCLVIYLISCGHGFNQITLLYVSRVDSCSADSSGLPGLWRKLLA